jgi:hypothetical protein
MSWVDTWREVTALSASIALISALVNALLVTGFHPREVNRWVRGYFIFSWAFIALRVVYTQTVIEPGNARPEWWSALSWVNVALACLTLSVALIGRLSDHLPAAAAVDRELPPPPPAPPRGGDHL